ncbi:MAG: hypothetical protein U0T81_12390 [Saprospiraceae bacterium]
MKALDEISATHVWSKLSLSRNYSVSVLAIGKMAGQVTEDNTHQLIPQAAAHPVRVGQNPLRGALDHRLQS